MVMKKLQELRKKYGPLYKLIEKNSRLIKFIKSRPLVQKMVEDLKPDLLNPEMVRDLLPEISNQLRTRSLYIHHLPMPA
ncbi:MAG: hypothetical protein ACTSVF_00985 [Candidatus Asgardarchaeia archaeon]